MEGIVSTLITAFVTLAGVIITNISSNKKIEKKLEIAQAVTDCKLEELTREVREHNNFAHRVPVLEEQMRVANHRIADLEKAQ